MGAHVLLIVENLPVPRDRRVWNEATTLRDAGYDVSVICPAGPGFEAEEEVLEGVRIHRHPVTPDTGSRVGFIREYVSALRHERRLARRIWRERPFAAIHICNPPDLLYLVAAPYRRWHGVKVIFDQHDLAPEIYETKFGRRGLVYRAMRWFERRTYRHADLVITTNESFRDIAIQRGGRRPEDVRIVRNGPDPGVFRPRTADPEVRAGRPLLVGWVGHMVSQVGLADLLFAAHHVIVERGRPDVHFMLIGDGPEFESTRALAAKLGIADHVELTGPRFGEDLLRRLTSCDIGILPLPDTPHGRLSTAIKTMEYMSLQLPVVQYDLLESRRTAGEAAVYARPGDPKSLGDRLLWLLERPVERERLGRLGRRKVAQELAWEHQAPKLLQAYAELIGER